MRAKSTINRAIRRLQSVLNSREEDIVTKRVAWEVLHALRWTVEDVKGWPSHVASCRSAAAMIRQDIETTPASAQTQKIR